MALFGCACTDLKVNEYVELSVFVRDKSCLVRVEVPDIAGEAQHHLIEEADADALNRPTLPPRQERLEAHDTILQHTQGDAQDAARTRYNVVCTQQTNKQTNIMIMSPSISVAYGVVLRVPRQRCDCC